MEMGAGMGFSPKPVYYSGPFKPPFQESQSPDAVSHKHIRMNCHTRLPAAKAMVAACVTVQLQ